ncbi:MAG: AsmA family protein [Thiohalocapsa sp. PB-PSB1]|jgi:hypothetical protein|nr:MAG: hypothetical protein N838_08520 [Thiohalocapsa sp. PB-PSB1]QQO56306.1 MAG: AsmA family protein [Thiohalocapsa sp. PB-PSB1]HCS90174.1 AsmA family protein [Chromatiaceae bacterium]
MSKLIKIGLVLLAMPLLLVLALAATAPFWIGRIGLAPAIETAVHETTGYGLSIDGEPRLRLSSTPVVELGPLSLSSDGDGQSPLAQGAALRLHVSALALLIGRLELRQAVFDAEQLSFPVGVPQTTGWQMPIPARIDVQNAHIELRYPDQTPGPSWNLFALDRGILRVGQRGRVEARFELDTVKPRLAGGLALSAGIERTSNPALAMQIDPPLRFVDFQLWGSDLSIGEGDGLDLALAAESIEQNPTSGTWQVPALTLTSSTLHIDSALELRRDQVGQVLAGRFDVAGFDLRGWMQTHGYGPGRGAPSTLRCAAARGQFMLDSDGLLLESAELLVDATHAAGSASVRFGLQPTTTTVLVLDQLDLDPYLIDEPPQSSPGFASGCALSAISPLNPPVLPEPDMQGGQSVQLEADLLRVGGLSCRQLAADLQQQGGLASADIKVADFYSGHLSAHAERDTRDSANPRQTVRGQALAMDASALLMDLRGTAPISGDADVRVELAASGSDAEALKGDLSGSVEVEIRNGHLPGLDITPMLTAIGGSPADAVAATAFETFSATAIGSGGLFQTKDLSVRSPLLLISGQGRFDVPVETLDLELLATFVTPPKQNALSGLAGLQVPMTITGTWQQPAWQADFGPALRAGADRVLKRNRASLRRLEERTGIKGLEKKLRDMLGF